MLCLPLPRALPASVDDAETSQPQQGTTTHYTNTCTILPCRRGDVSGERWERHNLLSFKHSMHAASSSITSHTAKILPAWKCYSSLSAHSLRFFSTKRALWLILSTTSQFLEFVSQFRSVPPDWFLYGFYSKNIFTSLKIRNYKKYKNLGGKGKGRERRSLSRVIR